MKPFSDYHKQSNSKDGYKYVCKECIRAGKTSQRVVVYPDPEGFKTCRRCGVCKPVSDFRKAQKVRDGLQSWCRQCFNEWTRENRPDKWITQKYGITRDDYNVLLAQQGGACAICGSTDSGSSNSKNLHIDHSHSTGKVRGLLCHQCNTLLGHCKENGYILHSALAYIAHHTAQGNM